MKGCHEKLAILAKCWRNGKYLLVTAISDLHGYLPENELADAISARDIDYALCGHVHTCNHFPES